MCQNLQLLYNPSFQSTLHETSMVNRTHTHTPCNDVFPNFLPDLPVYLKAQLQENCQLKINWPCLLRVIFRKMHYSRLKMAAVQSGCVCVCSNIVSTLEENKSKSCDTLKAKLHKAEQDISTYKEIIKILLEKQSSQPKQMKPDGPWNKEGSFRSISRGDSIKAAS